jgi:hypothetical protein
MAPSLPHQNKIGYNVFQSDLMSLQNGNKILHSNSKKTENQPIKRSLMIKEQYHL